MSRVSELEQKLKAEKMNMEDLEAKLVIYQDENHQLSIDFKQVQTKCIKYSEEILLLRQELQEASAGHWSNLTNFSWF